MAFAKYISDFSDIRVKKAFRNLVIIRIFTNFALQITISYQEIWKLLNNLTPPPLS